MSTFSRRNLMKMTGLASVALTIPTACSTSLNSSTVTSSPHPALTSRGIRLHSNENPYGPSEKAIQAIIDSARVGNRYGIPLREELKKRIAEREQVRPENVLISAGSSEVLGIVGHKYAHARAQLLTAQNTFPWLPNFMKTLGSPVIEIPLDQHDRFDLGTIRQAVNRDTGVVYICNPNNPTSTMVNTDELEQFCKTVSATTPVFVDEAYIEYTPGGRQNSMVHLIQDHPNVLISRTFSKIYGLAGMRIGYALAHADTIKDLHNYHSSFELSVSTSALCAALACIDDDEFLEMSLIKNNAVRQYLYSRLDRLIIPYAESATNFVFFSLDPFRVKGLDFVQAFEEKDIHIRPFPPNHPKWARISIGTQEEIEQVAAILERLV